jgi:hypothetical protein
MRRQLSCEGLRGEGAYFGVSFPANFLSWSISHVSHLPTVFLIPSRKCTWCKSHFPNKASTTFRDLLNATVPDFVFVITIYSTIYIAKLFNLFVCFSSLSWSFLHLQYVGVKSRSWIENCLSSSKNIVHGLQHFKHNIILTNSLIINANN